MRIAYLALLCAAATATSALTLPPRLSHWMTDLESIIGGQPLLALSLPGTHDSTSYDLSTTVSTNGIRSTWRSLLMQLLSRLRLFPAWSARSFAQTQTLSLEAQLDNGVRFLDVRAMLSRGEWRSPHLFESQEPLLIYLDRVARWMRRHPREAVVVWMSRHGENCFKGGRQYHGVSVDRKRALWHEIKRTFEGLLVDSREATMAHTPLTTLLDSGRRLFFLAEDWDELTGGDPLALDACVHLHNDVGLRDADDTDNMRAMLLGAFKSGASERATEAATGRMWLLSVAPEILSATARAALAWRMSRMLPWRPPQATAPTRSFTGSSSTEGDGWRTIIGQNESANSAAAAAVAIVAIGRAWTGTSGLPHAIYADGLLAGGWLRSTPQLGDPRFSSGKRPFVDALLRDSLTRICGAAPHAACQQADDALMARYIAAAASTSTSLATVTDSNAGSIDGLYL